MKRLIGLCAVSLTLMSLTACDNLIIDSRDNQVYRIVTIGNQTWMAQNLNYRYEQQPNPDSASFCYNNQVDSCTKYGRFYIRGSAIDMPGLVPGNSPLDCTADGNCNLSGNIRGVCPEGWHIPSKAEWDTLIATAGGPKEAAKKLKATSEWDNNGNEACGNGTDELLFTAVPAGMGFVQHLDAPPQPTLKSQASAGQGQLTFFWSSTVLEGGRAYFMALTSCDSDSLFSSTEELGQMQQMAFMQMLSMSVRCIKDDEQ